MRTSLRMTTQAGTVETLAVGIVTAMTDYSGNIIMDVTDDYRCLATNPGVYTRRSPRTLTENWRM